MAKNDTLLLDGVIDDRIERSIPSSKRDECFEFLAFEQILKDEDISYEEIISGIVDGKADGGIDGFYIFVNGHLLQDIEDFIWPKSFVELKLIIITCKHHDTFKKATIDSLIATFSEFFNFTIDNLKLKGEYNESLLNIRENLIFSMRKISSRLKKLTIEICYASRGDTNQIGDEVVSRADQVELILDSNFSDGEINFKFIGSTELLSLYRKVKNYTLELPFKEALTSDERYVILVKLKDYFNFISSNGVIKKHIFDANVRSFMGLNNVNEDIKYTLETGNDDFWLLNNGVTILVTSASITGKLLQASDVQVVNGLQTSQSIFNYLNNYSEVDDDRCVLVKVIVTKDEELRDKIIKATNNQTNVEISSLHATDKIQRDIEEILLKENLYYERRKNYYVNQGVNQNEVITPLYLASVFVCLVLKRIEKNSLKSKFMRSKEKYNKVFDSNINLNIWPVLAKIYKRTDFILEKIRPKKIGNEKFLKRWRNIISFLLVARFYGKFDFNNKEILNFDVSFIDEVKAKEIYDIVVDLYPDAKILNILNSRSLVINILISYSKLYSIENIGIIISENNDDIEEFESDVLSDEFIEKVRKILPPQPWKPRMERSLIRELNCSRDNYFSAVRKLIELGEFYHQKDGVLFDQQGQVVDFDKSRVDPITLELKQNPL
ncbi:abortive phage resistance protein [Acinetobacter calcoaceticus]